MPKKRPRLTDEEQVDKKAFPCPHCNLCYTREADQDHHVSETHLETKKEQNISNHEQCKMCNNFTDPSHLDRHIKTRTQHEVDQDIDESATHKKNKIINKRYCNKRCHICSKLFTDPSHFSRHLKIHGNTKRILCHVCGKDFRSLDALNCHSKTHNPVKKFICEFCGKSFLDKKGMIRHERVHTGERPYLCKVCGKAFKRDTHLKVHQMIHTNERPFPCEVCEKSFRQRGDLKMHRLTHSKRDKPWKCDDCDEQFTLKSARRLHMKVKHSKRNKRQTIKTKELVKDIVVNLPSDEELQDASPTDILLNADLIKITEGGVEIVTMPKKRPRLTDEEQVDKKPFPCYTCEADQDHHVSETHLETKKEQNIDNDESETHKKKRIQNKRYCNKSCHICSKLFTDPSHFNRHLKIHANTKRMLCDVCGKDFKTSETLSCHSKTHNPVLKQFVCKFCGKSFLDKRGMTRHERVHTGERPYLCKVCGKAFKRDSHLNVHQMIHTNERPFPCEVCEKSFRQRGDLKMHRLTHSKGDKPWKCDDCDKQFIQKSAWRLHKKVKHSEINERQIIETEEVVEVIVVNLPSDDESQLQDALPTDILLNAGLINITEREVEIISSDSPSNAAVVESLHTKEEIQV